MFEYETSDALLLYPFLEDEEGVEESLFPDETSGWGAVSLAEALLPLVESPPSTPPLQSPWMCYARYKTELCSRYTELGSCKYAERCQFAHGLRDLRVPSRHPKYKTEPCRAFHAGGYCAYGARCLFVHGPKEQRQARPPRGRSVPCRTYRSFGVCPFGARCHFLHVEGERGQPGGAGASAEEKGPHTQAPEQRPRGSLCRTFSAFGFCLYGTRCRFQHCLPSGAGSRASRIPQLPGLGRASSPASDMLSSSSTASSPPSSLPSPVYLEDRFPLTPPLLSGEPPEQDAFSFSGQHLNDLLLPLAWRLQQLEHSLARPATSPGLEAAAALPKGYSDLLS
ncbi:cysteine three histidine 1 [Conger conger]|uniref:cysteine three histidine 1 n=1 Tax=Conger conger TaxID=82655 RepID=UPI002A5A05E1|nr:cysteine three histidine 1 [Conger conger]